LDAYVKPNWRGRRSLSGLQATKAGQPEKIGLNLAQMQGAAADFHMCETFKGI